MCAAGRLDLLLLVRGLSGSPTVEPHPAAPPWSPTLEPAEVETDLTSTVSDQAMMELGASVASAAALNVRYLVPISNSCVHMDARMQYTSKSGVA